jgi:hypothetical protein
MWPYHCRCRSPVAKVTKAALLAAVHVQPVPAVTVIGTDPVPPSGPKVVVGLYDAERARGAVVAVASFLLHDAANSDAARVSTSGREERRFENHARSFEAVENT